MKVIHRGKMAHGGLFVHLKKPRSAQRLELNYYPRGNKYYENYHSGSEMDHLGFRVKNVDKTYAHLIKKGAKKALVPFSDDGQRLAYVRDPDGIWIEIYGPDTAAERK